MDALSLSQWPWLRPAIDFLFPPLCLGCGRFWEGPDEICDRCLISISELELPVCIACHRPIDEGCCCPGCGDEGLPLFAYGDYTGPLQDVIINFKFHSAQGVACLFGRLLAERFAHQIVMTGVDCLVPVPLHSSREYYRGYNQAELLGREIGKRIEIPCRTDLVQRVRKGKSQSSLSIERRAENVASAFQSIESDANGLKIVIVDDVVTSGATIMELKGTLEADGHRVVGVAAVGWAGGRS